MADEDSDDIAWDSLEEVQEYDVESLAREEDLGRALSFSEAVPLAEEIRELFQQIPLGSLEAFPENHLNRIKDQADDFFRQLEAIKSFSPESADPGAQRQSLIQSLADSRQKYFDALHPLISYAASRERDYSALEHEFRGKIQDAEDRAAQVMSDLESQQQEAKQILDDVRRVAEEQGVAQQAHYFMQEADAHEASATTWRRFTIGTAVGLGVLAVASVFVHKISYIAPSDTAEIIQLSLAKILLFAVVAYMLFLCARNFLSHKHNAVVNRHRQNALLTFNALADAAKDDDNRDIVLTHAASCIFAPQETGYTKQSSGHDGTSPRLIEFLPRMNVAGSSGS